MFLIASGAALLPASLRGAKGASVSLDSLKIDSDKEALLAEFVETLIPKTDTPGAKELKIHLFVMLMIDDCHNAADQRILERGLEKLDGLAKEHFDKGFRACSTDQRLELLSSLKIKKKVSAELFAFNALVKKRAIQGYLQSEYVMTRLLPHKMIPDPYDGYYPASKIMG